MDERALGGGALLGVEARGRGHGEIMPRGSTSATRSANEGAACTLGEDDGGVDLADQGADRVGVCAFDRPTRTRPFGASAASSMMNSSAEDRPDRERPRAHALSAPSTPAASPASASRSMRMVRAVLARRSRVEREQRVDGDTVGAELPRREEVIALDGRAEAEHGHRLEVARDAGRHRRTGLGARTGPRLALRSARRTASSAGRSGPRRPTNTRLRRRVRRTWRRSRVWRGRWYRHPRRAARRAGVNDVDGERKRRGRARIRHEQTSEARRTDARLRWSAPYPSSPAPIPAGVVPSTRSQTAVCSPS